MKVHPAIAALRGCPASQRRPSSLAQPGAAQENAAALKAVREAWLARPVTRTLAEALRRYGAGQRLATCKALHSLVHDRHCAQAFVGSLFERLVPVLRDRPLAEAPFRFKVSQGLATLQLMESGGAVLSLAAYEPLASVEAPRTALFSDREVHEIVLDGQAHGVSHRWEGEGNLTSVQRRWKHGDTIALGARCDARQILKVERSLFLLQLTREPKRAAPTRLVSLESGEILRTASGDKSASQAVMALSVLGALEHGAALGVIERTARNRAEDQDVRWEALRQALGLNAACGLELLRELEKCADDPLASPAARLKAQLLATQPELRCCIKEVIA